MAKKRLFRLTAAVLSAVLLVCAACGTGERQLKKGEVVRFRFVTARLTEDAAKAMIRKQQFFDSRWNRSGGFPNRFEVKTDKVFKIIDGKDVQVEVKIVKDGASGLTWHGGGSENPLTFEEAVEWVNKLNRDGFFGYNDWRIPTLEETLTLMEKKKTKKYHIDPVFDHTQYSTWTRDVYSDVRMWAVGFNFGRVFKSRPVEKDFIRPVRSDDDDT